MKRIKFTDSQIMETLKTVDAGFGLADVSKRLRIYYHSLYAWINKYGLSLVLFEKQHQVRLGNVWFISSDLIRLLGNST